MKRTIFIIIFTLLPFTSFSWVERECDGYFKQNLDINHSYYKLHNCWTFTNGEVKAFNAIFDDGFDYLTLDYRKKLVNKRWGNDYAYQFLKKSQIEDTIQSYNLGIPEIIDNKFTTINKNKARFEYKNYSTSDGLGFIGGATILDYYYSFLFFTSNKNAIISDKFKEEIISSLTLAGIQKGKFTSIRINNN